MVVVVVAVRGTEQVSGYCSVVEVVKSVVMTVVVVHWSV